MMNILKLAQEALTDFYTSTAERYKRYIDEGRLEYIDDYYLKSVAEGGYVHDHGFKGIDEGYKPYYEYLKKDLEERKKREEERKRNNDIQEEYNNEQLLLEDNNYNNTNIVQYEYIQPQYNYSYDYNNYYPQYEYIPQQYNYSYDYNNYNNYYTPYSYEYDPYIDYYNNGYNNDTVNTTVDLTNNNTFNDSITNVLDMIKSYKDTVNIFKPIKKKIINYISNYRPKYNSITGKIEAVLIE